MNVYITFSRSSTMLLKQADMKNLIPYFIGVAAGYIFRDQIGKVVGNITMKKDEAEIAAEELGGLHLGALQQNPMHMGGVHLGALQQNPHSAFDQTQAYPRAAFGPEGYGALDMGGLHTNPRHMGALHTNPRHMGALRMGALAR